VTPKVLDAFRTGGGLTYADYPGFHDAQAADSAAVNDASLIETIVPLTGLVDRLRAGIDVADIGCGEGHAVNLLAREFPNSRFWGFDFSPEALVPARAEAAAWGLANATFVECDVAGEADAEAYDLVTAFDAVHDQAHPATVLSNIHRSLRPGGTFLMVDIKASSHLENNVDLPWASFLYAVSTVHCMSVSLGQGGDGLGTVWGTELATQMLRAAGFAEVHQYELEQDPFNAYFVARRRGVAGR
jgi:SAM-dependent methyltransferase